MSKLRSDSGTGPDLLPARILKNCTAVPALPVLLLTQVILNTGVWPEMWLQHWVAPLHKKKSVFQPDNYRGVHLTAQLSKVVERLLKLLYQPYLTTISAFGPRQFAYTAGRGARDALALLAMVWIWALAQGQKIAVYCSDVSGAFDRVRLERLVKKLKSKRLHPQIVSVLASWLRRRTAQIVVGGATSDIMYLSNMVFQGTVTGPTLWNLFFEDSRRPIQECFYTEIGYADDLNAYRVFPSDSDNDGIKKNMKMCQQELHKWGAANQVVFDPAKESHHIISSADSSESTFKMLGVTFDTALSMSDAVSEIVMAAGWKLRTLLRTRRYYTDSDLIVLYKAHLLSFLEYRTPAIYHAARVVLNRLDAVQSKFLKDIGVDEVTALIEFHLAPLSVRRDIAMLGVIHRTVLGKGAPQFSDYFKAGQMQRLQDPRKESSAPLVRRSVFGLCAVYNLLPPGIVAMKSVKAFQKGVQEMISKLAISGHPQWREVVSPRVPLKTHPLVSLF